MSSVAWKLLPILIAVVGAAFAGCLDDEPERPVFLVPLGADAELGSGSYAMTIRVAEETLDGDSIPGAAVAVFTGYAEEPWDFDADFDLEFEQDVDGEWGSVDQGFDLAFGDANEYDFETAESARTGPDGLVLAHLRPGQTVTVVAGKAGYTTEKVTLVVGGANETGAVTIPLYHELVMVDRDGRLGPAASTRFLLGGSPVHVNGDDLAAVSFGGPEAHGAYMQRLVAAKVTVTWTNDATQYADFAAAAGSSPTPDWIADEEPQLPGSGESEETLQLRYDDLAEIRDEALAGGRPDLFVGAQARSASLGLPDGAVRYEVVTLGAFVGSASIVLE